jgi:hypothetical protein
VSCTLHVFELTDWANQLIQCNLHCSKHSSSDCSQRQVQTPQTAHF